MAPSKFATKFNHVVIVDTPDNDPSEYVVQESALGPLVKLPQLANGFNRVASMQHPYGVIQPGVIYVPDPADPKKEIATPGDPTKLARLEEAARARYIRLQEEAADARYWLIDAMGQRRLLSAEEAAKEVDNGSN